MAIETEKIQEAAFEIIVNAGNGKTLSAEALKLIKQGKFEEAEEKLDESNEAFLKAHKAQTDILQAYAGGEEVPMEIIFVHAQDHLMTGMSFRDVVIELLEVYKRLSALEK